MKKILFCNNLLSGLLIFRGNIINHYIDNDFSVILVTPEENDPDILNKIPKGAKYVPVKFDRTSTNPLNDIFFFFKLMVLFIKEKPDFVINYTIKPNIYGAIAAKFLHIRNIDMMAGLGYTFTNNNFSSRIARRLYKIGLKCTDALLLLNKMNVDKIIELNLCKQDKIVFLEGGEGVDLKKYKYYDNDADIVTFLFIGRLIFEKGYGVFAEAAKIIKRNNPNVNFEVLGEFDTTYPDSVSKERIEHDEKCGYIKYLGVTHDMSTIYRRKGIVVTIPSYYSEGLNRSLMEACSTGKPIITTNMSGCKETVVDNVNGFLVVKKDVNSLIEAINKYLSLSREDRRQFSISSRRHAEELFDVENVIKVYDDLLLKSI
jgi:glycosyltransferase involved in cell wall biosynthesis